MTDGLKLTIRGSVCPVTALSVCHGKILAGCGSEIQIFDSGMGQLETAFSGLHHTNIHGFRPGPEVDDGTAVLVFGGKCVRTFTMPASAQMQVVSSNSSQNRCGSSCQEYEDWIWDAVWLKDQQWTIALAVAHNVVLHADIQTGAILHKVTCTEKCLLYCARFIGSSWSDLIVAAGTVFNQIVLWAVSGRQGNDDDSDDEARAVLHRLTGHQGVIFSVYYNKALQRICSVSDDRSIRMWQLLFPAFTDSKQQSPRVDWRGVTFTPLLTLYGHSARVWDVVLLSNRFVSVGEDACCIVWDYSGQVLQRCKGHKGRSIWSLAASDDETFVVTGGGDSSVRQWHLQNLDDSHLTQVHLCIPQQIQVSGDDFVRTLALWDYNTVVLMTNKGSLLCHTVSTNSWQVVFHDPAFSSYSTLALSSDRTFLAVGSIAGCVRVVTRSKGADSIMPTKECTSQLHEGKVCGLTWVDDTHFVSAGLGGHCILAGVNHDETPGDVSVSPIAHFELPACKHRWVVAGCLLPDKTHLVCGDRNGSIHFYRLSSDFQAGNLSQPLQTFPKIHGNAGVTSAITRENVVLTAGRDGQYRRWAIKDGRLDLLNSSRVFKGFDWIDQLVLMNGEMFIYGFYSSKFIVWSPSHGERLLEVECGGGHRAWDCLHGDQGYRFVFLKARHVIMVTGQQTVGQTILKPPLHGLKVCDMKHISTYRDKEGRPVHVVCTGSEDTTINVGTLHSEKESVQWTGRHCLHGHLSSVRALAVADCSPPVQQSASSSSFDSSHQAAGNTGTEAEETANVTTASQTNASIECGPAKNAQTSAAANTAEASSDNTKEACGLRDMQSKILFSAGGRAQIQVWKLSLSPKPPLHSPTDNGDQQPGDSAGSEDQLETSYEHIGGCFLGESRHKRSVKPWKTRYLKLDPETRIMDLAAVEARSLDPRLPCGMYLLASAGSDGVLRLFLFEESDHQFTLLCQSSHHNGCVLKVHIHLVKFTAGVRPILLSAATDGKIAVRDLTPVTQWLLAYTGQQNAGAACDTQSGPTSVCDQTVSPENDCMATFDKVSLKQASGDALRSISQKPSSSTSSSGSESAKPQEKDSGLSESDTPLKGAEANSGTNFQRKISDEEEDESSDDDQPQETRTVSRIFNKEVQYLSRKWLLCLHALLNGRVGGGSAKVQEADLCDELTQQEMKAIPDWAPDQEVRCHQSGVNSLYMKSFEAGKVLLASGGDDNALSVCHLTLMSPTEIKEQNTSVNRHPMFSVDTVTAKVDAHAAQITGVWILSSQHILTASIDQRVTVWHLQKETQAFQLVLESSRVVDISDISALDVWTEGSTVYIGVCGEGIALLTLDANHHAE